MFYAVGGPGGAGTALAQSYLDSFDARLRKELDVALQTPNVRNFMQGAALETLSMSPEDFGVFLRQERDRATKTIKEAGIRVD